MPEKITEKVQPRKQTPTDKVPTGIAGVIEWAKQHPGLLIPAAAAVGISGEQLKTALSYEGPAWILGVLVLVWALFKALREHLNQQRQVADAVTSLQTSFAEFRDDVSRQLDNGVGRFEKHDITLQDHGERIGRLENIHAAELAAHAENTRRETGKVAL